MVAMTNRSYSSSDLGVSDRDFSPRLHHLYSPLSNYSNISHDASYSGSHNGGFHDLSVSEHEFASPRHDAISIGQPDHKSSDYDDYSHIHFPSRKARGGAPDPPLRTSSVMSFNSDYMQRSYPCNNQQYYSHRSNSNQHNYSQTRRKTWTPSQIKKEMTGGLHGNLTHGHLLPEGHEVRRSEDNEVGPPKLAPFSGMLSKSPAKGIIRPIAFKPVVISNHNYVNTRHFDHKTPQQDDGYYGSQDYPMTNQNVADMSHGSLHFDSDRSTNYSSDSQKLYTPERPESTRSSCISHASSLRMEGYIQTPSPSDSGVGELEAMLKEKDAEINTLRDVMDKNERAIFQVYEEKKNSWSQEIKEVRDEYEKKLKLEQRKAYKTEQTLSLQVYKLQQEKKTLNEKMEEMHAQYKKLQQRCDSYEKENDSLRSEVVNVSLQGDRTAEDMEDLQHQVEILNQSLSEKSIEISELESKLCQIESENQKKDYELSERFREIVAKTDELKSLRANLRRVSNNNVMDILDCSFNQSGEEFSAPEERTSPLTSSRLTSPVNHRLPNASPLNLSNKSTSSLSSESDKDKTISHLQKELEELKEGLMGKNELFEKEKEQWLDEKNKVIRYQKQLQLNYVQMYNKNKMLEAEVEQLTLELESRDMKLMAINGEESMC
ncbi:leucine zipper putative tumor suppressor 2 homolog [Saccostrea cucullata]|uniref:leucine zipper putative tumor suppressor 2 homolog n=1 Tax=Saccostrea cuccullata TaxID=36930 RepID=UPI002ED0B7C5